MQTLKERHRLVVHYPEVTLKGKNRSDFARQLTTNIRKRLRREGFVLKVRRHQGRVFVDLDSVEQAEPVMELLASVPGAAKIARTRWVPPDRIWRRGHEPDRELLAELMVEMARENYRPGSSFVVRVNRVDKRFPGTSVDLERWLGGEILERTPWERVRLKDPDVTLTLDLYPDGFFFSAARAVGVGGLPVGSSGQVLTLLSGGIDSPVAAYMVARRGCQVDFFHMTVGHPANVDPDRNVVSRLAAHLSRYTLRSRLYLAPYVHFDMALMGSSTGYELMLLRRFIARAAERLAHRIEAQALVTGDSIGQVASQTIENLVSASQGVHMPILRPLVAYNKNDIITLAQEIGTYELSIERYKDCCALLSGRPRTRTHHEQLAALERKLIPDYDKLLEATLADVVVLQFDCGERVSSPPRMT